MKLDKQCYYDINGIPYEGTIEEQIASWSKDFHNRSLKNKGFVGKTRIKGTKFSCMVSTVWLGMDHGFMNDVPIIFETMVFGLPEGHEYNQYQERYSTLKQAEEGHSRIVKLMKTKFKDPKP